MENCGALAEIIQKSFPFVPSIMRITIPIFSPFIIILNTSLIVSFVATKQVHLNTSNFLIMCLSLSDLLNGVITIPVLSFSLHKMDDMKSCSGFVTGQISSSFFSLLSAALTFLIAIDRYLNMNPNLERRSRFAKVFQEPQIYYLLITVTLGVLLISVAGIFTLSIQSTHFAILNASSAFLTMVVVSLMTVMYAKGYIRIRNFTDASPVYRERNGKATRPQYVRNLYKSVMVLVILSISLSAPTCSVSIAMSLVFLMGSRKNYSVVCSCYLLVCMLIYLNCIVNTLVIFRFNKIAREWILTKIRSCFPRGRGEAVNVATNAVSVPAAQQSQPHVLETKL